MKIVRLCASAMIILSCLPAVSAMADPCPNAKPNADVKPGDEGNCVPAFGETLPVAFDFPELKKSDGTPKANSNTDDNRDKENSGKTAQNMQNRHPEGAEDAENPSPANHHGQADDRKPSVRHTPTVCTYRAYAWDTKNNRSTDHFSVEKSYADVTDAERDPDAPSCTICSEDQVSINPREYGIDHAPIKICYIYADRVRDALIAIHQSGTFDIQKLEGYRPGRTRGKVDKNGLRTEWSKHSFGAAIDINANHNAIYSNCKNKAVNASSDLKGCKRGIGGAWIPEKKPRVSIVKDGIVVKEMEKFWKWGGEIEGSTKDIMHFSVTGY